MIAVDFGGIFQGIQSARSLTVNEVNYWGVENQRIQMLVTVSRSIITDYQYLFTIYVLPLSHSHGLPTHLQRNLVTQTHGSAGYCPG